MKGNSYMRTTKIFAIGIVLILGMCMVSSASTGHATVIHETPQPVAHGSPSVYTTHEYISTHSTHGSVPYVFYYTPLTKK